MPSSKSRDKSANGSSMYTAKAKKVRVKANNFDDGKANIRRLDAKSYMALFVEQKKKCAAREPSKEPKMLEKLPQSDCRAIDSRESEVKQQSVDNQSEDKLWEKSVNSVEGPELFNGTTPEAQHKEVIIVDKNEARERNGDCEFPASRCKSNDVELDSSKRMSSEVHLDDVSSAPHKEGPSECDAEIHASELDDIPPLSFHDKTSHVESDRVEADSESQVKLVSAATISIQNSLRVDIELEDDEENEHLEDADDLENCDALRDSKQTLGFDSPHVSRSGNGANDLSGRCASSPRRHRFVEYWVPARLSNLQLEQYCFALLSNSMSLRSSSRSDPVGALRSLLVTLRQTCSHPFLVDRSLSSSLLKGVEVTEYLDVGIKASGKLQLLDTMLVEMRKQGLRVLILYESIDGRDGIGDILDDFLRQRYGQDSYERVDGGGFIPSKRQGALNKFNDKESGRFVFLLEAHACLPSIKLSSVDAIIIHNSEWNPVNDIRALQRIVIDSQHDPIKVFRLFLPHTVEENAMILAKHNVTLDNSMYNINQSNRDKLLISGASDLFDELERLHHVAAPVSTLISSFEGSLLQDVVQELMKIFLQNERQMSDGLSICLKVQRGGGDHDKYHLVSDELTSPLSEEKWPREFWSKLVEGRNPQWKFVSSSNLRNRKRVRYDESENAHSNKSADVVKRRRKVVNDSTDITSAVANEKLVASDKGSGCDKHLSQSSHLSSSTVVADDGCIPSDVLDSSAVKPGNTIEESRKVYDTQKGLLMLKSEMGKLCQLLNMPEDVKNLAERFLEYVMENHLVSREPVTLLQAFQLSVIWIAASLRKQKINGNESLALVRQHLNFCCSEDDADLVYSKMGLFKELFIHSIMNGKANDLAYDKASRVADTNKLMVKSIKHIERKCRQRFEILKQKQLKETEQLQKSVDEEKARLEEGYKVEVAVVRSMHVHNPSIAADKLKVIEDHFSKRLEEHWNNRNIRLKSLEHKHLSERDKENELTSCWKEDIVKEQLEILRKLPHSDSENSGRKSFSSEHLMVCDGHKNGCSLENQDTLRSRPDIRAQSDGVGQSGISDGSSTLHTAAPVVSVSAKVLLEHSASFLGGGPLTCGQAANSVDLTPDIEMPESSSADALPLHLSTTDTPSGGKALASPFVSQQLLPSADLISGSGLLNTITNDGAQSNSNGNAVGNEHESEAPTDPILPFPPSPSALHKEVDNSSHIEFPLLHADNVLTPSQLNVEVPATEGQPEWRPSTITLSSEQSGADLQLDRSLLRTTTDNVDVVPSAAELSNQLPQSPIVGSSSRLPNFSQSLLEVQSSRGISSTPNADDLNFEHLNPSPLPSAVNFSCTPPTSIAISRSASLTGPRATQSMSDFVSILNPGETTASTLPSQVPFSHSDPLLGELERIQKEADQSIIIYEELKQKLNIECEKEIEEMVSQLRKKYETKILELDAAFTFKKNELDSYHRKVYLNKKLAEAFRNKCMELKVPAPRGMSQDNMQRQMPRTPYEYAQRAVSGPSSTMQSSGNLQAIPNLVHPGVLIVATTQNSLCPGNLATPSRLSAVRTSGSQQTTRNPVCVGFTTGTSEAAPLPRYTAPLHSALPSTRLRNSMGTSPTTEATMSCPVQIVNHTSALFSSNTSRLVSVTPTMNLHSVSEIRAPPPHLRSRVSQPMTPNTTFPACPSSHPQYSNASLASPSGNITNGSASTNQMSSEFQNLLSNDMAVNVPYFPVDLSSSLPQTFVCLSDDDE
ncbi:hypothetical protein QQ045_030033 [Rhodiola kirilowii]